MQFYNVPFNFLPRIENRIYMYCNEFISIFHFHTRLSGFCTLCHCTALKQYVYLNKAFPLVTYPDASSLCIFFIYISLAHFMVTQIEAPCYNSKCGCLSYTLTGTLPSILKQYFCLLKTHLSYPSVCDV